MNVNSTAERIVDFIVDPECGVDVHQIRYNTLDPAGQPTTASGALMIPTGTNAACTGARPIVVYAHGTSAEKSYNIADLTNPDNAEGLLIAATFAAQGYIVVAPNYAGYDTSTLPYHPYLHAEQQAKDTSDALTAARSALPTSTAPTVTDNGRLFITGYSQGGLRRDGHASIAANEWRGRDSVRADVGTLCALPRSVTPCFKVRSSERTGAGELAHDRVSTHLRQHLFRADRCVRGSIRNRHRSVAADDEARDDSSTIKVCCRNDQLFNSTPPDPAYAAYTPATTPADLAPVFARGFGTDNLMTNTFRGSVSAGLAGASGRRLPDRHRWFARRRARQSAAHRIQSKRFA